MARGRWAGALRDVGSCPEQPLEPDAVAGRVGHRLHRGGQQRERCKHADTLKARNHWKGVGWVLVRISFK